MSKRFWLLGLVGLVLVGFLVACGSKYNSSSDGLLLVGSQGSSVIETFSFTLNNGHVAAIANSPTDTGNQTCLLNGSPSSMVVNPAGTYAYVIFNKSSLCPSATKFGIATFQISSSGKVTQVGSLTSDPNPTALSMDAAGKFLFVAEGTNSAATALNSGPCPGTTAQYGICVYAIDSSGALTGAPGNFSFQNAPVTPNIVAVGATPTVFPGIGINGTQNSSCSIPGNAPPTSQYLYAVDSVNYLVWEFTVNTTTGALGNPTGMPSFATDAVPAGVAVDPCDRFVFVSGSLNSKVSAYTICTLVQNPGPCPNADGSLVQVSGSPFSLTGGANGVGPLVVDPYGNNVYVVGRSSNTVSTLRITSVSGSLTVAPSTTATGSQPTSIAIRGDDNWLFVTNNGSATVSQYAITPATGALSATPPIATDNLPWGVAVK